MGCGPEYALLSRAAQQDRRPASAHGHVDGEPASAGSCSGVLSCGCSGLQGQRGRRGVHDGEPRLLAISALGSAPQNRTRPVKCTRKSKSKLISKTPGHVGFGSDLTS